MTRRYIDPKKPPLLWSDVAKAFDDINQNFIDFEALIGGPGVDFTSLSTSVIPSRTEFYDLGSSSKRWKDLYLGGSSLYLGDAVITSTGSTINLPAGVTIGGNIVDSEYFREIAVAGQDNIVADVGGAAVLTVASGNSPGISISTNPATDTLIISNSGVREVNGTAGQIGVSSTTGSVTLTNLGVLNIVPGFGISVNQSTGSVTVTNDGLAGIDAGLGITVSARDPITGKVTVTNSQPNIPQNVFSSIAVPTQSTVIADSTTDTLTVQTSGNGLSITTDSLTDTITFTNTGVTSLAVGNGLTSSGGTGSINLTLDATLIRNIIGDIRGSLFADDSSVLVDATGSMIYGNIRATTLRTQDVKIILGQGASAGNYGIGIGYEAGKTGQGDGAVAIGLTSGRTNQGNYAVSVGRDSGYNNQGVQAVSIGSEAGSSNQGTNSIAIGYRAGYNSQNANSIVLNASGAALNGSAAGFFVDPIRSTATGTGPLMYNSTTKEIFYNTVLEFAGSKISTNDSSGITVDVLTTFNTDVVMENDATVNGVLNVGSLNIDGAITGGGTGTLTVNNLNVTGTITSTGSGTPEVFSDNEILLTAGTRVEITSSPLKMASFTTAARDLLAAVNGDMIYNSTTNRFQGYANGTWVDLH